MSGAFELDATIEMFAPGDEYTGPRLQTGSLNGVLMDFDMPRPTDEPPTARLSLLQTAYQMSHNDLLLWSPYPYGTKNVPQPVIPIQMGDMIVRTASRYTRSPGQGILLLSLMTDSGRSPKNIHPYHETVRRTVALACARALLEPLPDSEDTIIMLNSVLNFEHPKRLRSQPAIAIRGLSEFALAMSCNDLPQPPV